MPLSLEVRRLFLRIGWSIAHFILDKNSQHPKYPLLPEICKTNLNMASKLGKEDDIEQCLKMRAAHNS